MRPDTGALDRHLSNLILAPAVNSLCETINHWDDHTVMKFDLTLIVCNFVKLKVTCKKMIMTRKSMTSIKMVPLQDMSHTPKKLR